MFSLDVLIPDFKLGGGEALTRRFVEYLVASESRVNVRVYSQQKADLCGVSETICRSWKTSFFFYFLKKFRNHRPTLVVLTGPILIYGLSRKKSNVYLYEHGDPFVLVSLEKSRLRSMLYKRAIKNAKQLIVVNPAVKEKFLNHFSLDTNKVAVVENPVKPITSNACFFNSKAVASKFGAIVIGRSSPEKRLEFGLQFLKDQSQTITNIVLVSDTSDFDRAGVASYRSYDSLPRLDVSQYILFNFSYSETFSLVIGEWLAAGGLVCSVACPQMISLWSQYRGFFVIGAGVDVERLLQPDGRPVFHGRCDAEYGMELLGILS
ncbi:glycosyltransferase [Litorivivens sp.]|uniref:glycosyltransferase n=1 Tax=Litorivivens sp. TaxID=2020868 RepID=UPI0035653D69